MFLMHKSLKNFGRQTRAFLNQRLQSRVNEVDTEQRGHAASRG